MRSPRNVVLLLTTGTDAKRKRGLEAPTLDDLTDALADMYVELGCEETVAAVQASFDAPRGRQVVGVGDIDTSPDQIASYLWDEMVGRLS